MDNKKKVTNAEKKQVTSEIYKSNVFLLINLTNGSECLSYVCGVKRRRTGRGSHSDVSR